MSETHDFQFILPEKNNDLLNSRGDQFYVQQVYTPTEIPDQLVACKSKVHQRDPFYIFEHFDVYYSIIEQSANDGAAIRNLMRAFDLLYLTVDILGGQLTPLLTAAESPSSQDRGRYLNLTKMTLYLFVNTVKRIDVIVQQVLRDQKLNQQKKRAKQAEVLEQYPDWEVKRSKFLVQLYNVMQCPLEKLWSPPVVEETFVTLMCDICYRTLEVVQPRSENRHIIDTLFQIFGLAIKRYNHAITFPARILQILRSTEHAATAVANGILLLYEEYGITTVFSILMKDIADALTMDTSDTTVSRNFSNFLSEFSLIAPKLMIPHLSKLGDELLNCESHVLRNCVLQIMGDAVVSELTSEDLSDDMKEARDEFLNNLLDHINDISAHVRSKVLHIWHHMKEQHAIPLTYLIKVLREAVCRLEDKSSMVRKSAIQLIKAFLENNPYSGKLTLEELMKKHETEVEVMKQLDDVIADERKKAEDFNEQWESITPELIPIIEENLRDFPEMQFDKEEEYEQLVHKILPVLLEKKYKEATVLVRKADYVMGNQELSRLLKPDEACVYHLGLFKTFLSLANGCIDSGEKMLQQIKTVEFLKDSIEFTHVATSAMPKMLEMLLSKTNTDVFEAVDLFTTGYLFGIRGTDVGMQRMLNLVWSSDKEKRDAVCNAYRKVLFTTDTTGRAHAIKVVKNLSKFLSEVEYGHYTAMETLMGEWVGSEDIDALIIQVLFERFTLKLEGTTKNESRLALQLLIMASQTKSTIASANRVLIEDIATGERAEQDPRIFTSCLQLLVNCIDANYNNKYYKRCATNSKFVQQITNLFLQFFFHPQVPDFDALAMSVFEYYYRICQAPDVLAGNIAMELIRRFNDDWLVRSAAATEESAPPTQGTDIPHSQELPQTQTQTQSNDADGPPPKMPVYLVSRFVFCIGFMIIKEMIFLDMDVYNNMKFREELTALEEKKNTKNAISAHRRQTVNVSAMEARKRLSGVAAEPQQEPDDDLVGATAEDNIAEDINAICEDMLLYEPNALMSKVYPIIIDICKRPGEYRDQQLQQAATLTLARLMTVSSKFCETNMSFLMNILNLTKNLKIKCNTVVGLSDLTFRFPNIIEAWTGHFYAQMYESDTELRLTAVKMLSHLILHEMIRVKGQIADIAVCIVDESDEIKNITKQFFKEIANKSNILYNVLPDIISKLGDINLQLEEEKYRTIMRYILGLIQKDRQIETLVEKLCLRFPVTRVERQWRDIAYCLGLLTYNERSINKLIDNVQHFRDKVQVDEVYQSFKLIISNTSKLAKPELKAVVTEFETRLNECLQVTEPNGNQPAEGSQPGSQRATKTKKGGKPAAKQQRGRQSVKVAANNTRRGRNVRKESSSEEEEEVETSASESDESPARPAAHSKQQRRKIAALSSSASEDSEDEEELAAPSRKTQSSRRSRK
ncbi:condensin complex subunit 1 [Drosophila grimshawi]|uniref:Condensin complex subunit 1 n=1 Tax=Drosophila grimshawi TaxID=7222 RepID=B4J6N9_DROGR|nr:condensin complex subunit 1 [Drosophila grimshawi]EDW00942.1 GH20737 [Drosophila grimshawi]